MITYGLLWASTYLLSLGSAEIITLIKNEEITCVLTEDHIGSNVYVDPPIDSPLSRKDTGAIVWITDDWNLTQSTRTLQGPISKQLWMDKFRISRVPSRDEEPSTLSIQQFEDVEICLSMSVSLDRNSSLQIVLESDGDEMDIKNITGLHEWKEMKVQVSTNGLAKLSFLRILNRNATAGYWAIKDIQFCNDDRDVFRAQLPSRPEENVNYLCKPIEQKSLESDNTKFSMCQEKGFIGANCDIRCHSVLGDQYENCEGHKICYGNSNCFCAWDYIGDKCEKNSQSERPEALSNIHLQHNVKDGSRKNEENQIIHQTLIVEDISINDMQSIPDKHEENVAQFYLNLWPKVVYALAILIIACITLFISRRILSKKYKENRAIKYQLENGTADIELQNIEKYEYILLS